MKHIYGSHANEGGIYVIFNTIKWRLYVGSCASFKKRWFQHQQALQNTKHRNRFLQADYAQCGQEAFEFHVLEVMPLAIKADRLAREQYWIDVHFDNGQQCYNLRKEAVSREGFADRDPTISKQRRSEAAKLAGCKPPNMRGIPRSEETKQKIRAALAGKPKPPCSEATRQKRRENGIGNKNGVGYRHTEEAKARIGEASRKRQA